VRLLPSSELQSYYGGYTETKGQPGQTLTSSA
jgi:hypothetical protein